MRHDYACNGKHSVGKALLGISVDISPSLLLRTSSSAVAERPRCGVGQFRPKYVDDDTLHRTNSIDVLRDKFTFIRKKHIMRFEPPLGQPFVHC